MPPRTKAAVTISEHDGLPATASYPARTERHINGVAAPIRMLLCLAVSIGLLTLAGISTAVLVDRRDRAVETIHDDTMGRVEAAWDIHRHLASAASAAADSFLSLADSPDGSTRADREFDAEMRGVATGTTRAGEPVVASPQDVECPAASKAPDAVATAADGRGNKPAGVPESGAGFAPLTTLACLTPVYTGLVGEARANSRHGDSVGAAYLRRAATLMHDGLLPASHELARSHATRLAADYEQARRAADVWIVLGTGLLAIGALVAAQMFLVRWTNRWLCLPLLAATVLAVAGLTWTLVAFDRERANLVAAYTEGYEPRSQLAHVRQLALRAEGDVLYWRIAQGGSVAFNEDYKRVARQLDCALQGRPAAVGDPPCGNPWGPAVDVDTAARVRSAVVRGDSALTTGVCNSAPDGSTRGCPEPGSGTPLATPKEVRVAFATGEHAIDTADGRLEAEFDNAFSRAAEWLDGLAGGTAALFGVAAVLTAVGMARRLWEYR